MLPPHRYYYLHNFLRAMLWLRERYADVLGSAEHRFITQFEQLPLLSQALLVRLLMRRGPWFLKAKLSYSEIENVSEAAEGPLALGWLDARQPLSLDELFALHTKAELLQLFADSPSHGAMRKADMLQLLRATHDVSKSYAVWNPQSPHAAWRFTLGELCERLRLMFFGNLRQTWSEFVLADLGIFRYEPVPLSSASRAFDRQEDVDCYLAIHRCREALESGQPPHVLLVDADRCSSANPWIETRRTKLLMRIGQACERSQDWALAEQAYRQSSYPGARYRRMRVFERSEQFGEALDLAQAAQAAPENEEEKQRIARMLPRLQRKLGQRVDRKAAPNIARDTPRSDVVLPQPCSSTPVEALLRDRLNHALAPVFYVENALLNSLFGLLCWPAIFEALPGAFFHPFQSGPADLGAPDFSARRTASLDACLALLADGRYGRVIQQRFIDKNGVQSPFVFWGVITQELLDLALQCIPAQHLKRIFDRMLLDLKANRSGFPDLVRFWPAEQRYEMIEVKGPGDKLQDNQMRWLQFFAEHGIPARVCHVQWQSRQPEPCVSGDGRPEVATVCA